MKIQVTQEHIDQGITSSCSKCPVALALSQYFDMVNVCQIAILAGQSTADYSRYVPTEEVANFIHKFDEEFPVSPFSFEIPDTFLALVKENVPNT